MAKISYYEYDSEKLVKVKDLIIFLDDLITEEKLGPVQAEMTQALKGFFRRLLTAKD